MRRAAAGLIAVVLLAVLPSAQAPRFRSAAEAVRVDVLVLDGGKPVPGLTAADFELRDSGQPQVVDGVEEFEVPFSMMLALDTSDSMLPDLGRLKNAALSAVDALRPDDRAAALAFGHTIAMATPWSASRQDLAAAIGGLRANGTTSLADAAFAALLQRDSEPGRRNLVILFSDGSDTSSWLSDDAVFGLAERTEVVVYGVRIGRRPKPEKRPLHFRSGVRLTSSQPFVRREDFLDELAQRTGGDSFSTTSGDLQKTFRRIVETFRSRYVLAYTPRNISGAGWHPIEVRVKGQPFKVVARRGYQR